MSAYADRFWKKSWDEGMTDIDPSAFETTYVDMIRPTFEEMPDKAALGYLGVDVTFGDLDRYSNQFANMLLEEGFQKGDVVGIHLPNTPEYVIALIGTLKAGCVVSGVSPLMSRSLSVSSLRTPVRCQSPIAVWLQFGMKSRISLIMFLTKSVLPALRSSSARLSML